MANKRKRTRQRRAAGQTAPVETAAVPAPPARPAAPARVKDPKERAVPPTPLGREPLVVAGLVGAVAFLIYALTVEPGVPTGDSGELISSAYVLGIPHPPGYPLYMLLGHLATLFPGGSPALRMNLLSGLLDA